MKHTLLVYCVLISSALAAQTSKIAEPAQAGTLYTFFTPQEKSTLTSLTLKGKIDARDFAFLRDELKALSSLSLQLATIQPYSGTDGTYTGEQISYPANEIPEFAFYNPVLQTYKPGLTNVTLPVSATSSCFMSAGILWLLPCQIM